MAQTSQRMEAVILKYAVLEQKRLKHSWKTSVHYYRDATNLFWTIFSMSSSRIVDLLLGVWWRWGAA